MDGYVQDFRITNSSSLLKKEEDFFHPRKFERFLGFLSDLQTKKKTHVYYYSYVRHGGGRRAFDEMDGHAWLNEINGRPRALTFTFRDGILTNTRLYYSMWTPSRRYYGIVK